MKIQVRVVPNSRVEEVVSDGDNFVARVKEPPREGKANRAAIGLLAEHFKVPRSSIRIVSGLSSRNKIIEVLGK
jgi:uncharacterized protein (TIGR00251 family)